jgi:hypothetical protein
VKDFESPEGLTKRSQRIDTPRFFISLNIFFHIKISGFAEKAGKENIFMLICFYKGNMYK